VPTTPVQEPPLLPPIEGVEQRFRRLETQWRADTLVLSDPGKIMGHPAMRAIIAMGEDVVPLILRDLRDNPSVLVWALPEITGQNLAPPRTEGGFLKRSVDSQIAAWLQWGREKGLDCLSPRLLRVRTPQADNHRRS
jgi:hypothetical protein